MSDQGSSDGPDIKENDLQAFILAVPANGNSGEFANYLRLGNANSADEAKLPEDPAYDSPLIKAGAATGSQTPFANGELVYSTAATQLVAPYSYIRMGVGRDAATGGDPLAYETWLPISTPPTLPTADTPPPKFMPTTASGGFPTNGIVIYSNDTVQIYGATINEKSNTKTESTSDFTSWTMGDKLSVVSKDDIAVSASYTLPGGSAASSTTFNFIDQMGLTAGNNSSFTTGNALTYVLGNVALSSMGMGLRSNIGSTQNLFGGQIVNVTNTQMRIQGSGESNLVASHSTIALRSVALSVSPVSMSNLGMSTKIISALSITMGVIGAIVATIDLQDTIEVGIEADFVRDSSEMKRMMAASFAELSTALGLIAVVQAMAATAGIVNAVVAKVAAYTPGTTGILIEDGLIRITAGPAIQYVVSTQGFDSTGPTVAQNVAIATFA